MQIQHLELLNHLSTDSELNNMTSVGFKLPHFLTYTVSQGHSSDIDNNLGY